MRCTIVGVEGEWGVRDELEEEADEGGRADKVPAELAEAEALAGLAELLRLVGSRVGDGCLLDGVAFGVGVDGLDFLSGVAGRTLIAAVRLTFSAPRWGSGLIARLSFFPD